ncbi:MAG TPA: hypothetical protein VFT57_10015 [Gemmatimonadaceae bacterium]|nr:hypothetical protein [Gemmatimonadaceae bacterium]
MRSSWLVAALLIAVSLTFLATQPMAQQPADSAAPHPPWRDSVRYGGGPSVGAPPSNFKGDSPPARWCLETTDQAQGDFGRTGRSWTEISRSWLRQVLSDTTDFGTNWRKVLGGAPRLTQSDSIVQVTDEDTCRAIAQIINRELLGWKVGPPPVVVFRIHDYLIAYPSNAGLGEFGLAVGMNLERTINGVSTW